jgi:hypothetical protein
MNSYTQQPDRSEYVDLWRDTFGRPPPKNISMGFMQRAIDFERQCMSERRMSKQTLRSLKAIAKDGASTVNPMSSLKPGTHLMREWNGRIYQVEIIKGGFVMGGKTYASLSAIAKHITGAHWSGPRFFGLSS